MSEKDIKAQAFVEAIGSLQQILARLQGEFDGIRVDDPDRKRHCELLADALDQKLAAALEEVRELRLVSPPGTPH